MKHVNGGKNLALNVFLKTLVFAHFLNETLLLFSFRKMTKQVWFGLFLQNLIKTFNLTNLLKIHIGGQSFNYVVINYIKNEFNNLNFIIN